MEKTRRVQVGAAAQLELGARRLDARASRHAHGSAERCSNEPSRQLQPNERRQDRKCSASRELRPSNQSVPPAEDTDQTHCSRRREAADREEPVSIVDVELNALLLLVSCCAPAPSLCFESGYELGGGRGAIVMRALPPPASPMSCRNLSMRADSFACPAHSRPHQHPSPLASHQRRTNLQPCESFLALRVALSPRAVSLRQSPFQTRAAVALAAHEKLVAHVQSVAVLLSVACGAV